MVGWSHIPVIHHFHPQLISKLIQILWIGTCWIRSLRTLGTKTCVALHGLDALDDVITCDAIQCQQLNISAGGRWPMFRCILATDVFMVRSMPLELEKKSHGGTSPWRGCQSFQGCENQESSALLQQCQAHDKLRSDIRRKRFPPQLPYESDF